MSKNSLPNPTSRRFSSTCPLNVFKFYFLHLGLWISSNSFLQKSWGWNSSSLLFGYGCSVVPFIGKTISSSTESPLRLSLRAQDSGKSVRMWGCETTDGSPQAEWEQIQPPPPFLFRLGPEGTGWHPAPLPRGGSSTLPTSPAPNANLFWKHRHNYKYFRHLGTP